MGHFNTAVTAAPAGRTQREGPSGPASGRSGTRPPAAIPDDGRNVVLHEFAHQLDQETGVANGAPHLPGRARHERWSRVMTAAFLRLRWQLQALEQADAGLGPAIDPGPHLDAYAAQDPAEFFAVATEAFFERAPWLAATHPALYAELRDCYAVDPLAW